MSHFDLVFHRVQREGQQGISYNFGGIWWYLVVHVCVNSACIHTYWPSFLGFHEKWHFLYKKRCFCQKHMKQHLKATKTTDSTQISHFDLIFHIVQRGRSTRYILYFVVIGGACMCKWYMYTHILTWFCWFSWKVALFHKKHMKSTWKATKQLIQHRCLILTWSFIEYRGKANKVYLIFWWYLVVHVCVNSACIHIYWPGFDGFHEDWHFLYKKWCFRQKHLKQHLKATKNSWFNTDVSFWPDLSYSTKGRSTRYILYFVVIGGACGACMCKWCMYTHILT